MRPTVGRPSKSHTSDKSIALCAEIDLAKVKYTVYVGTSQYMTQHAVLPTGRSEFAFTNRGFALLAVQVPREAGRKDSHAHGHDGGTQDIPSL